jgi:hypothetical protein
MSFSKGAIMARRLFKLSAGIAMMSITIPGWTENRTRCSDKGPPRIWAVKSSYPFQAGAEATFDELYHGQWRARVDIPLYREPRSRQVAGMVKKGTVVNALLGETIVVHPLRFVASQDFKVSTGFVGQKYKLLTMRKGDVFWVLQSEGEGGVRDLVAVQRGWLGFDRCSRGRRKSLRTFRLERGAMGGGFKS